MPKETIRIDLDANQAWSAFDRELTRVAGEQRKNERRQSTIEERLSWSELVKSKKVNIK